jgi:uncharacterized NAD(P)/FAD-binding protein YdhS
MCDMVVSLRQQGHSGPILAISRRALLPRVQAAFTDVCSLAMPALLPATARELLALVRHRVRTAEQAGMDWRPAIDAVRRRLPELWSALPPQEQRRVAQRLRPFWDVHRFRMAPQVARLLDDGRRAAWLRIENGRIRGIHTDPQGGLSVAWARGGGAVVDEPADAFINCIGPSGDLARSDNPIFRSLLSQGLAQADPLRLGLDCDADGCLRDAAGRLQMRLRVAGPLARAVIGEVVGVPEASAHARRVAAALVHLLQADGPSASRPPPPEFTLPLTP